MLRAGFRQLYGSGYILYTMYKMKYKRIYMGGCIMNLNVLRYVIEVEKNRSITGAARQLFISQPNLSRDIRELEEEIGFSIFTRSSRGVIPTEKGREFLALAKRAVKQYQALENYCTRRNGTISACISASPAPATSPARSPLFSAKTPGAGSCR